MLNQVIVIGCPGAGKSTFARKLRDKTGLPLYYLDMLWHRPDQTTVSRQEFDRRLAEVMSQDRWIIDGNYSRTMETRFRACDTVFFLDLPVEECLAAAESRIGRPREDMPWVETALDEEFRQWILSFPQRELPGIYALIDRFQAEKRVFVFHSRDEIQRYFGTAFD